ncbi:MAG TPA: DUF6265 family protein [Candidatus Krumholzibacteria bacterium]|nr:DUF6265 family protein [Candidatus Krumholzibacteria bacterium]
MTRIVVPALTALLCAAPALAQTQATENTFRLDAMENMPKAKLSDVAWIAGWWEGTGIDARAEEVWSEAAGGAMMGMFRLIEEGETVFYELMTIAETDGSLTLVLKHFNDDLTGWEEHDEVVEFPLVRLSDDEAVFDGLTYRRKGDKGLHVFVLVAGDDGTLEEMEFTYDRASGPPAGKGRRSR